MDLKGLWSAMIPIEGMDHPANNFPIRIYDNHKTPNGNRLDLKNMSGNWWVGHGSAWGTCTGTAWPHQETNRTDKAPVRHLGYGLALLGARVRKPPIL